MIAAVYHADTPKTIEEKRSFLLEHRIALWDVIASCEIKGSSDSSISNVVANDLTDILKAAPIEKIFVNGKAAQKYYEAYAKNKIEREATYLPSTSPANAAWSLDRLVEEWSVIRY